MYDSKADQDRKHPNSELNAEPSAKVQLEGTMGEVDKLILMMLAMKSMQPQGVGPASMQGPPSPSVGAGHLPPGASPMGGPPMPGGMPGGPPMPMGAPGLMPQTQLAAQMQAAKGLV